MKTWGTAIKDNDTFADIYCEFFDLYNQGEQPNDISKKLIEEIYGILERGEDRNNFWFALSLAQWKTKCFDSEVLSAVENIITTGHDLKMWGERDASKKDIKKRQIVLEKFLVKIKSERPKAKARKNP